MKTIKKITVRPHRVSRAGNGGIAPPSGTKVLQMNAAGISDSRRKIARQETQEKSTTATEIIVHELRDDGTLTGIDEYPQEPGDRPPGNAASLRSGSSCRPGSSARKSP